MVWMDSIEWRVHDLRVGDDASKSTAAAALGNLAYMNPGNKVAIAEAGGVPLLVQLLRNGTVKAKVNAARTLGNLAMHNDVNAVTIGEAGGIPPLVELARDQGALEALTTLNVITLNNDTNTVAFAVAVSSDALVELARHGRVTFKGYWLAYNAGLPAKRKAALVVAALLEAAAPRTRVSRYIKAAIGSYL